MSGPSFRFRLERVRALRERAEDAAKEALAGAVNDHRRSERELADAEQRLADARAAQLSATSEPTSAADLIAHQAYLERTEQTQRARRDDLGQREQELDQRRAQLMIAAREREALERLKASRRSDHERELARRESIALDEIAINGFRRRTA
jgi:flagellar protein FliJ